jgi:hypothetical protein
MKTKNYVVIFTIIFISIPICVNSQNSININTQDLSLNVKQDSSVNVKNELNIVSTDTLINSSKNDTKERITTITVCSSGSTVEEAMKHAFRNALEQVFGVFISSKTEIFNDKLVSDNMVAVASGNIQSSEILNKKQFDDGNWGITIKVYVSISNLIKYVESHGINVEFKGNLFSQKIEQQILNEQAELKAVLNMIGLIHEKMQTALDYDITYKEPISVDSESKKWKIPLEVKAKANKNMDVCATYMINTLKYLSLSTEELDFYKQSNKSIFEIKIGDNTFFLRKEYSFKVITAITDCWLYYFSGFSVDNGLEMSYFNFIYNKEDNDSIIASASLYNDKKIIIKSHIPVMIKKIEIYDDFHRNGKTRIEFPKQGDIVGSCKWDDVKTLDQINKITNYNVKPLNIRSNFKEGGILINESSDGHGLVACLIDFEEAYWGYVIEHYNNMNFNGYNDWRIPTYEELKVLMKFLKPEDKNLYNYSSYWAADRNPLPFKGGDVRKDDKYYTRLVRTF